MKRLVLLGGGHAHVGVLADLAARPLHFWEVHLVSPYRRQIYSGMLPGWIAGHYSIESCAIELDALAERAGVTFHNTMGVELDPIRNQLRCANGETMDFDQLSVDTGSMPTIDDLPGCMQHALPIRPIEEFIAKWPDLASRIQKHHGCFDLAILGGGPAGVELAFAIQHHAATQKWPQLRVTLVGTDALPMQGMPVGLRQRAMKLLERRGILWQGQRRAIRIDAGAIGFENGDALQFNESLVVTGAAAPTWAKSSGLATDERGFIRVGPTLQSVSHPQVFAAGDVASYQDARPKSGVYAVKAGPALARNLRAKCEGHELENWQPQTRALYLISTGRRHALGVHGRWTFGGNWVWYWKDWIDRRFLRRFGVST